MSATDKTLLLLHGVASAVAEAEIRAWVEYSNSTRYRRDILEDAHRAKLVEYDPAAKTVLISPRGVAHVEERLIRRRPE